MSLTASIPIPSSPAVDTRTGYPTREWYLYWQQPAFQNISFTGQVPVTSGGTGLSGGVPGGILAFASQTEIVSSGELDAYRIVFGGGPGSAPSTPVGNGDNRSVLVGASFAYPGWYHFVDSASIKWAFDDINQTITPVLANPLPIAAIDSVQITGSQSNGTAQISLVNDSAVPGNSRFYGTDSSGTLGYQPFIPDAQDAVGSILDNGPDIALAYTAHTSIEATLNPTTITAGTYGDATHIPQITFDAKGRATSATVIPFTSSGGVLPVVTGGVQNSQPTFVYLDDGSLVYAEAA